LPRKTNNPKLLCKCGAEISNLATWVRCSCGALHHFKMNKNGRLKASFCHTKGVIHLINWLMAKGVSIKQLEK